ncbi:MAG: hypothetical protein H6923_10160 [Alphaproteobacteria bacterium]|nr:hypothetical protein [Alphaproteobacteria bacterium]
MRRSIPRRDRPVARAHVLRLPVAAVLLAGLVLSAQVVAAEWRHRGEEASAATLAP